MPLDRAPPLPTVVLPPLPVLMWPPVPSVVPLDEVQATKVKAVRPVSHWAPRGGRAFFIGKILSAWWLDSSCKEVASSITENGRSAR